ncbi:MULTISPECIES: ABC transporter permease [Psychrobacillus]|uniref:ABC transporter permease n=1 Tax=Psychrobacillus faecigallinarum TaxID=2762235 RepID=A0ABR8RAS8_9BACI|nr:MULTISPECIES: ABC transporter permease [Psychrobacillus]MBD7944845.1 ABC transporter permease [Psychrobacillus faecigallinarum]QEY21294.1 ABC transporter permease [Psychrobacillus sp. AK 1817]QGM31809.1 ABC transporter permease subunit [Bacillus sp. N3536]
MRDEKGLVDRDYEPYETEQKEWKKQQLRERGKQLLTITSPILILILWEVFSRTGILDIRFFPPPSAIVSTFFELATNGMLWTHVSVSLYRIAMGFLLGVIPGVVIGLLMGLYAPIRHFISPIVMAFMPIPTLALMPIIIILFGIGDFSKVVTIAGSVFFPVVINTVAGVLNIDQVHLDVAKNYGASPKNFFVKIAFPGALPVMLEGIQMGQAIALLTIVAAEMMGATSGIGFLIWTSYKAFMLKEMFVGLVLISFFGFLFSLLLRGLQKRIVPWR